MIGDDLNRCTYPLSHLGQVLMHRLRRAARQHLHRQDMYIVMIQTIAFATKLGQGNTQDDQALVCSQLDSQIKQIDPIGVARQRTAQQEQANTQQPQADCLRTRSDGNAQAVQSGKDQGGGPITGVRIADPGKS